MIPKIIFTCGGSGGHVTPAIAIAQELPAKSFLFLTSSNRKDKDIVSQNQLPYLALGNAPTSPLGYARFFFKALHLFLTQRPQLVVSTGGGQTLPILFAAILLFIPYVIQEQNTIPGRVNRLLQFGAKRIFLSFPESVPFFKTRTCKVVGNPVRKTFAEDTYSKHLQTLTLPNLPIIVCFGGSQGAHFLNTLFKLHYSHFLNAPFVLIHVTGEKFFKNNFKDKDFFSVTDENGAIKVLAFPYFEKMDLLFQKASLVVCRSGASTLSELFYFKKPAVLVPFPFSKDNHQHANALHMQQQGVAHIIEEHSFTFESLIPYFSKSWPPFPPSDFSKARTRIAQEILAMVK